MPIEIKKDFLEKYRKAREHIESGKERTLAVVFGVSEGVKYRLTMRKGNRGIIHTLEIMSDNSTIPAVKIDLLGNWEAVLDEADYVLSNMSMDDFRKVAEFIKENFTQARSRGSAKEI
jgi:hypothetical protein